MLCYAMLCYASISQCRDHLQARQTKPEAHDIILQQMQEYQQFSADPGARPYRAEDVVMTTTTKTYIEERFELVSKADFHKQHGCYPDDTTPSLQLVKWKRPSTGS